MVASIPDNSHLYTPAIQRSIKRLAYAFSFSRGGAVDRDDLFFAAENAIARKLHKYDPTLSSNPCFLTWAVCCAQYAMKDAMRTSNVVRGCRQTKEYPTFTYISRLTDEETDNVLGTEQCVDLYEEIERNDRAARVSRMMHVLSPPHREIVRMLYWEGHKQEDVAQKMGCSSSNIGLLLRKTIKPALKQEWSNPKAFVEEIRAATKAEKEAQEAARIEGLRAKVIGTRRATNLRARKLSLLTATGFSAASHPKSRLFMHPRIRRHLTMAQALVIAQHLYDDKDPSEVFNSALDMG
jgi:RNA polymerase sigma factor (sigma-70 family)